MSESRRPYLDARQRKTGRVSDREDYEQTYDDFWKEIVEHPDGTLNRDQIMRELHDYREQIEQVSIACDDVTGGRISKPNTMAFEVINEVEERTQEALREQAREIAERLVAEGYPECAAIARDIAGIEGETADG